MSGDRSQDGGTEAPANTSGADAGESETPAWIAPPVADGEGDNPAGVTDTTGPADAAEPSTSPPADGTGSTSPKNPRRSKSSEGQGWFTSLLIAFILALGIRHFLVQAYKIPSGSMIPTLLIGDQLIASKISYGIRLPFASSKLVRFQVPRRGEIVVFKFPDDPSKDFIKRTVAVPGDRIRIEKGEVIINDVPVKREYKEDFSYKSGGGRVNARVYVEEGDACDYTVMYSKGGYHSFWDMPEVQLADDEIFVMGDNRDHSNDSRFWGPVKLDLLEGKPLVIHFSWDGLDSSVRVERMGDGLLCKG